MAVLDVADQILEAHGRQGAPPEVIAKVREFRGALRAIDDALHLPRRAGELKAALTASTIDAARQQLAEFEADAAKAEAATLARHDEQQSARLQANGDRVDAMRISAAQTIAELRMVMDDAFAADAETARRTWMLVKPKMRSLMESESRRHVMPSRNSAFTAFNIIEMKMRDLANYSPDRTQVTEAGARRQRELREQILGVWRVAGLDQEIARAAVKAAVSTPSESRMVVGGWFDRFGNGKK